MAKKAKTKKARKRKICLSLQGSPEGQKRIAKLCRYFGKVKKKKAGANPAGQSLVLKVKKGARMGKILSFLLAQPWVTGVRLVRKHKAAR